MNRTKFGGKSMLIAPKMAEQYAQLAREGKADRIIGGSIYEFERGNQIITLVSLDPLQGHVTLKGKGGVDHEHVLQCLVYET